MWWAERWAELISSYSAVVKWAEEAIKWYGSELGEDSKQVAGMQETAADPRSHAAWGAYSEAHTATQVDSISTNAFRFRGVTSMGLLPVLDVKCNGSGLSVGRELE